MSASAHAAGSSRANSLEGRTLEGRYRIDERLGEGGLGTVYRAQHLKLARSVAIKVLRDELRQIPQIRARFEREVRALSSLSHPNIITITDFGISDGMPFLVMELAPGRELAKMVGAPMPAARAFGIIRQILSSLAYAHEQDVVHRDLKPANVIVRELPDGSDHVTVLDFGLAKFVGDGDPHADLTRSGLVVGTPAYMPPEQMAAGDRKAEARSDLYATGLILFELLTGRRPFLYEEPAELLRAHLVMQPPTLAEALPGATVDPRLEVLVSRALAKTPAERFPSARAMIEAIDSLSDEAMLLPGARAKVREDERPPSRAFTVERPRGPSLGDKILRVLVVVLTFTSTAFGIAWYAEKESHSGAPQRSAEATTTRSAAPPAQRMAPATPSAATEPAPASSAEMVPVAAAIQADDVEVADIIEGEPELEIVEPTLSEEPIPDDGLTAPIPEAPEPARASTGPRAPARDLLRGRLPQPLDRVRDRLERHRSVHQNDVDALTRYRATHPMDPRVRLLIGHSYMQRGWMSAALDQYERAYALDSSSRGDPNMLANIVRIARTETLEPRARAMVLRMYGREARNAVARAIERTRDEGEERRLRALLARL
jgi:eukaryotic-like serine/threonine-protein kinase